MFALGDGDDPAAAGADQAEYAFEQRAFAGAVGADDRRQRTLFERAADMMQCRMAAIGDGQIVDADDGTARMFDVGGMGGVIVMIVTVAVIMIVAMFVIVATGLDGRVVQEKSPVSAQYTPAHNSAQTGSTNTTRSQPGQLIMLPSRKKFLSARTACPCLLVCQIKHWYSRLQLGCKQ